jgi:hypothetical protein
MAKKRPCVFSSAKQCPTFLALAAAATIAFIDMRPAKADDVQGVCAGVALPSLATGSSQIPSSCTLPAGSVLLETLYYQNASKVGGTALAAFPLLELSAGVARGLDFVVDPPSQIAESGPRGAGMYPRSHSSYAVRYRFSETSRIALSAGFAIAPPASMYAPSEAQSKYLFGVDSGYRLTPGLTLKGIAQASTLRTAADGRALAAQALGADISLSRTTVISPDIGQRSVAARAQAQSFADLCLKRSLDREVTFDMGLGTAFNPVARAKAHYLAAGLSFRP